MNLDVNVDIKLPVITNNFEVVKIQLVDELKKYDLIVDEDSVKTAKSMATDINKLKKTIDDLRKSKVKDMSAPIKEFEIKAKKLTSLCEESRQKLLTQVKVFDDKQKEKCLELVSAYKNEIETKFEIKEGFEIEIPFDLAIISNLTKTGISKKARDTIEDRVLSAKNFQDKIEKRLLSLPSICFENGLMTALTTENINHFLMDRDDSSYHSKLLSLIKNEVTRQEKYKLMIEEKAKKEAEAKANVKNEVKQEIIKPAKIEIEPKPLSISELQKQANTAPITKNSIKRYTVTATFEIEANESIESKLESMLLKKFEQACFKKIPEIKIVKH